MQESCSFNLWSEPWITLEDMQGKLITVGIEKLLSNAGDYRTLFDPSPLVVVGIHRLLVAILQDMLQPQSEMDLADLWEAEVFPVEQIHQFGQKYAHRFDIFSVESPFLQSADLPLHPPKKGKGKSVGYLLEEQPAGTAVTHYNHIYDSDQRLCAACCAKGLLTIPAFASSGGAGIKPSINGVPPIYVIPGGETIYHSLVGSLLTPPYQPDVADRDNDTPWWRHSPVIGKKMEVLNVGYLHSLTFPARRVRLHPQQMSIPCTRCGQTMAWCASEMIFEMGESRPKDAAFWQDPFAAYRIREKQTPLPIRPVKGRAAWREYSGLFLPQRTSNSFIRPSVVDQLEDLGDDLPYDEHTHLPFTTTGLRTDMKMKIWEWESSGFLIPPSMLSNPFTAVKIESGLDFASKCDYIIKSTFRQYFGGDGKSEKHANLKNRLSQSYWQRLASPFDVFIQSLAPATGLDRPFHIWLDIVQDTAIDEFGLVTEFVGTNAVTLRERVQAISHNRAKIFKMRKDNYPKEVINE